MKNNQGLAPIIIILIVIGVSAAGAGVYYLQTNKTTSETTSLSTGKNETVNWKTYTNEGFKFILDYPENYRQEECSLLKNRCISFYPPNKSKGDFYKGDLVITTPKMPKNYSVEQYLNEFNDYLYKYTERYEEILVGGKKAIIFYNIKTVNLHPDIIIIFYKMPDDTFLWIENLGNETILKQILSTFKFIQ